MGCCFASCILCLCVLKTIHNSSASLPAQRMYDEFDIAERLRFRGWVVPAFTMPENAENVKVLRITIREDLSVQMADKVGWFGKGG